MPDNRLSRQFRDLAGEVNQRLAPSGRRGLAGGFGLPLRLK
jgi:adenosyl cobinamide kinase/adenosyl cobinamide phosphate guanylyltransferase